MKSAELSGIYLPDVVAESAAGALVSSIVVTAKVVGSSSKTSILEFICSSNSSCRMDIVLLASMIYHDKNYDIYIFITCRSHHTCTMLS